MPERSFYFFHPQSNCPESALEMKLVKVVVNDTTSKDEWLEEYAKRTGKVFTCSSCGLVLINPDNQENKLAVESDDADQQRADWEGMAPPPQIPDDDSELRQIVEDDFYRGRTAG